MGKGEKNVVFKIEEEKCLAEWESAAIAALKSAEGFIKRTSSEDENLVDAVYMLTVALWQLVGFQKKALLNTQKVLAPLISLIGEDDEHKSGMS